MATKKKAPSGSKKKPIEQNDPCAKPAGASAGYLSWDVAEHRERILKRELPNSRLWIFAEIHKYRSWRNFLKGVYDGRRSGQRILITGSARLDFDRFSGDSLQCSAEPKSEIRNPIRDAGYEMRLQKIRDIPVSASRIAHPE